MDIPDNQLLDVHAICDQRDRLQQRVDALKHETTVSETPVSDAAEAIGWRDQMRSLERQLTIAKAESKRWHDEFCKETLTTDRLTREVGRLRELVDNARSTVVLAVGMLRRVPPPEPDTARDPLG